MSGKVFLAFLVLALVGCGESESGGTKSGGGTSGSSGTGGMATGGSGGTSADPVPLGEFVTRYVGAICDHIDECCDRGGFVFDAAACRTAMQDYATAVAAGAMSNPPKSDYDAARAGECVALVVTRGEECVLSPLPDPNPCDEMFTGRLAQGEACAANTECAPVPGSIVQCASTGGANPICDAFPAPDRDRAAGGEPCGTTCEEVGNSVACDDAVIPNAPDTACYTSDGLYCSSSGVCEPVPSVGQPCGSGNYCEEEAYCDSGTCTEKRETGGCESNAVCVSTSYCDLDTSMCTAKGEDGAACPRPDQDADECLSGGCNRGVCGPPLLASEVNCFSN